jgi:hypothetical protein
MIVWPLLAVVRQRWRSAASGSDAATALQNGAAGHEQVVKIGVAVMARLKANLAFPKLAPLRHPSKSENVRSSGETGSDPRALRTNRMTRIGHWPPGARSSVQRARWSNGASSDGRPIRVRYLPLRECDSRRSNAGNVRFQQRAGCGITK